MDHRPVTLHEVAAEAGVSIATASRAMTRPECLRADTVARIRAVAHELGYRPNLIAQSLKLGSTGVIYIVIPNLSPFFLEIFSGIERAAREFGYSAIIGHTDRDAEREAGFFDQVACGRADGVLLLASGRIDLPAAYLSSRPSAVAVFETVEGQELPSVRIDQFEAAQKATNHLIELGHRDIAHISGNARALTAARRRQGFVAAMHAAGLEGAEANCVPAEFTPEAGAAAMDLLLDRPVRPTAVFAANDEVAIGAMLAIRAAGLRVPEDISVIGYGNHSLGRIYHPALTTVHVPALDLGYLAMVKLKRILKHESYEMDTCLATHLIKRATTAPPGQSAGGAKA